METKIHITNKKFIIKFTEENGVITQKTCVTCSILLPIFNFPTLKGSFANKNHNCKKCESIRQHKIRESKGSSKKQPIVLKENENFSRQCSKCKYIKNINEYNLNLTGYLGHDSECKECKRKRSELFRRSKGIKPKREVPVLKNEQGIITHRKCSRCLKMIELSQFNKHSGMTSTAYLAIHPYCKECAANQHLISKYGITKEQKLEMIKLQNNKCKTCKVEMSVNKLIIDHCHNSGKIRGILCNDCNLTLGLVKDNTQTLQNMIDYLKDNAIIE